MSTPGILAYIKLTHPQGRFLREVANRGGEIGFDWHNPELKPEARKMVEDLIEKRLLEKAGGEGKRLRLTDQGRQAISQIDAAMKRQVTA